MSLHRTLRRVAFTAASLLLASGAMGQTMKYEFLWGAFGPKEPQVNTSVVPQIKRDRVKVLYNWQAGKYPAIWQGQTYFGGVPVAADMAGHLAKLTTDINQYMPDVNFNGFAVIDYESWEIFWDDTHESYKQLARDIARATYAGATDAQIEEYAKRDHEAAAKTFLLETLRKAKQLRPHAHWGYYGYPRDFHVYRKAELQWLWDEIGALYPSNYTCYPSSSANPPPFWNAPMNYYEDMVVELMTGTARQLMGNRPVVPFVWCRYHDLNDVYRLQMLNSQDLERMFRLPREHGADSVIIWEYFGTDAEAAQYNTYVPQNLTSLLSQLDLRFNPPSDTSTAGSGGSGGSSGNSGGTPPPPPPPGDGASSSANAGTTPPPPGNVVTHNNSNTATDGGTEGENAPVDPNLTEQTTALPSDENAEQPAPAPKDSKKAAKEKKKKQTVVTRKNQAVVAKAQKKVLQRDLDRIAAERRLAEMMAKYRQSRMVDVPTRSE